MNEPFGITTLEAQGKGLFCLGINNGGTPEIVRHGLGGFLYPNTRSISQKVLDHFLKYQKKTKY